MQKILIPSKGVEDWRHLLADPLKHWKSGYSAKATASSWEASDGLPSEILRILGQDSELLFAIPEHKVPLPGGKRESQCDVFALVRRRERTCALAVEAKVNEPFGPTVGEWMQKKTPGRIERLSSICHMLDVPYPPPAHLRYQLFHRTAAAIVEAERFKTDDAGMIVQSFSQVRRWFEDFAEFCDYLGVTASPEKPIKKTLPVGKPLILGWATGSPEFL